MSFSAFSSSQTGRRTDLLGKTAQLWRIDNKQKYDRDVIKLAECWYRSRFWHIVTCECPNLNEQNGIDMPCVNEKPEKVRRTYIMLGPSPEKAGQQRIPRLYFASKSQLTTIRRSIGSSWSWMFGLVNRDAFIAQSHIHWRLPPGSDFAFAIDLLFDWLLYCRICSRVVFVSV